MRWKVLDVLPMMCDRSGADVVFPGGAAAVDEDYWFGDANGAEGEERAQPHESEQRDCSERGKNTRPLSLSWRSANSLFANIMAGWMFCRVTLPFSRWPLSYYSIAGRWVVCATTSLPALAQLDSKHVLFPRGGNKMRYNGIHHADCRESGPRREECLEWQDERLRLRWSHKNVGCKVQSSSEVLPNKEEETDLLILLCVGIWLMLMRLTTPGARKWKRKGKSKPLWCVARFVLLV